MTTSPQTHTPLKAALTSAIGFAALLMASALHAQANILLIVSDDHGAADSGSYGNTEISTPNIDRLSKQGIRFNAAFTTQAICTPSRSSLFTGLYPMRHGAHRNHTSVNEDTLSLPHYFQPLGYKVYLAGKTHIGPDSAFPFETLSAEGLIPFSTSITDYFRSMRDVFHSDEAFVMVVSTSLPHTPLGEHRYPDSQRYQANNISLPPYLVDTKETRRARAGYYELVSQFDRDLGVMLQMLDDSPAADITYVIYLSDHGAGFAFEKWTNYDAGIRIPLIVRAPDRRNAGTSSDAMVSIIDVLPTMLSLAGQNQQQSIDGRSFKKLIDNPELDHRDYIFATHTTLGIRNASDAMPIRTIRNKRFKYIKNLNPEGVLTNNVTETGQSAWPSWLSAASNGNAQAQQRISAYQSRPEEELYSLEADPYELKNVIANPGYAPMLANMRAALELEMARQDDQGLKASHTESNIGFVARLLWATQSAWQRLRGLFSAD
ncbi:MAG: sulfatase [Pseudomonadales bacterium]